jgi:DNA-binding GntR family transcriptional regulator
VARRERIVKRRRKPAARRSLSETVYQHLKEYIVAGRLLPGAQILVVDEGDERALVRSDLHQALKLQPLQRLAHGSAADPKLPRDLLLESLREIFEFREAIEGQVARLATERIDAEVRGNLGELLERFQESVQRADPRAFLEADTRLHRTLVAACGNRRMQRTVLSRATVRG